MSQGHPEMESTPQEDETHLITDTMEALVQEGQLTGLGLAILVSVALVSTSAALATYVLAQKTLHEDFYYVAAALSGVLAGFSWFILVFPRALIVLAVVGTLGVIYAIGIVLGRIASGGGPRDLPTRE